MKSLEKSLTVYIKEKHTQEECVGFIDGYKQAHKDMSFKSLIISKLRNLLIVNKLKQYNIFA
jgi:hypothetical protein